MKLLVFAHIPPPHHGQSYMVKLMLDGFGGDARKGRHPASSIQHPAIECYHVNAQFSQDMEDIGVLRSGKIFLLLRYCAEAIWCRFRYGVTNFYYIPAPGKRTTMFRDWIVMALCRPFFKRVIFHWHALGLGDWLHDDCPFWHRWITHWLMDRPELSIALAIANMRTALWFKSRCVEIVPNGIPDPCPDFDETVLPLRKARAEARRELLAASAVPSGGTLPPMSSALVAGDAEDSAAPVEMGDLRPETGDRKSQSPESSDQRPATSHQSSVISGQQPATSIEDALIFRVLYLAHCTRDKGLFDTLDAVALANSKLKTQNSPLRIALTVAGAFLDEAEHEEFNRRIAQPDLMGDTNPVTSNQFPVASIQKPAVTCADFVSGEAKDALLRESDCYLFPTYYSAEAQPVSIIEAMAFGLPVISTRWRAIPDVLPVEYPCLIDIRDTARAAELLLSLAGQPGPFEELRAHFLKCYSDRQHIRRLRDALLSVEERIGRGHGDCAP